MISRVQGSFQTYRRKHSIYVRWGKLTGLPCEPSLSNLVILTLPFLSDWLLAGCWPSKVRGVRLRNHYPSNFDRGCCIEVSHWSKWNPETNLLPSDDN